MIRYLLVLRINNPIVRLPVCLPANLSFVVGTLIAERLSAQRLRPWRRTLAVWNRLKGNQNQSHKRVDRSPPPEASWPIETVWFPYPGKRYYRSGEKLLLEFKILGDDADHGVFLETILPVLEASGYRIDLPDYGTTSLWGHFEIQAVYVARGKRWEPLVQEGTLDLTYRATSSQWLEKADITSLPDMSCQRLSWITPYAFDPPTDAQPATISRMNAVPSIPRLETIVHAVIERISTVLPGRRNDTNLFWESIDGKTAEGLREALRRAESIGLQDQDILPVPKSFPGQGIGRMVFNQIIPKELIPLLEIGSILHVGRQTHFGCGTYCLS